LRNTYNKTDQADQRDCVGGVRTNQPNPPGYGPETT